MRNKVKLKNGTVLKVGNKYVHATWLKDEVYEVTAIGNSIFTYIPKGCDYELTHEIDNDWIPYEEEEVSADDACYIMADYIRDNGFPKSKCELIHTSSKGYYSFEMLMQKVYDQTEEQWKKYWDKVYPKKTEEKKEKWYYCLTKTLTRGNFTTYYTPCPSTEDIILREWHSKEQMINDLKKG